MSNKKRVNRKRRRSPWYKMFAKTETRLAAHVTSEDDWQTDVPNIRLSRAFVIVLLMHLVVGGALVAFTLMNPSEANAQGGKPAVVPRKAEKVASVTPAVVKNSTGETGAGEISTAKPESKPQTPAPDDMRRHIVHSGDSVAKIARQYGVTAEQIHAVNRIDELYQLYQGRVLRIPLSVSTPVPLNSRIAEIPSTNGSNAVSSEPSRLPVTIPRATIPAAVEISADTDHEPIDHSLMRPEEELSRPVVEVEPTAPAIADEEPSEPEPTLEVPAALAVSESAPSPVEDSAPIVRPHEQPKPTPTPAPAPAARPTAEQKTYQVQKGDNAFRIGQRFGVHYNELLKHNGIADASKLQVGQVLRIPNN